MMPYWQIISNFTVIKSTVEIFKYMQMCRISSYLYSIYGQIDMCVDIRKQWIL